MHKPNYRRSAARQRASQPCFRSHGVLLQDAHRVLHPTLSLADQPTADLNLIQEGSWGGRYSIRPNRNLPKKRNKAIKRTKIRNNKKYGYEYECKYRIRLYFQLLDVLKILLTFGRRLMASFS